MESGEEWQTIFYTTASNRSPVEEFIETLDFKTQVRFKWSIEQLRLRNTLAREPLVKHIEGQIWELRRESDTNIFRLLYAVLPGKRLVLLHVFQKKSQKTPRREIATAKERLDDFLQRSKEVTP